MNFKLPEPMCYDVMSIAHVFGLLGDLHTRIKKVKYLLRIRDTDQSRLIADATGSITEYLQCAGIAVDKLREQFRVFYGPYSVSGRTQIYVCENV